MFNKITRGIPVIFLWVAGLAIIAHMIIPHDHHQEESDAGQENSCPVSNDKTGNHSGFPIHCHICNDLTSEKAIILVVHRNIQCTNILTERSINFTFPGLNTCITKIFEFPGTNFKSEIPGLYLLRAPPCTV
jgi:hypothetical protein